MDLMPDPACRLFLHGQLVKKGFSSFKWLRIKSKGESYFVTCEKYMEMKFQCL